MGGTMMDVGVYGSNPNLTSGMTQQQKIDI